MIAAPIIAREPRKHGCGYYVGVISALVFALMILTAIINQIRDTKLEMMPKEKKAKEKGSAALITAAGAAKQLRDSMRNPDSFKLTRALLMKSDAFCFEFRSQNGFGGVNSGYAVLAPSGRFLTNEMSGGTTLWNKECAGKNGTDKTSEVAYVAGFQGMFN